MALTLQNVGDRELWLISGMTSEARAYTLPILVDYFEAQVSEEVKRTFCRINYPVGLNPEQESVLDGRIRPHMYKSAEGNRLITKGALNEIATKAPGITPAYYVQWPGDASVSADPLEREEIDPDYHSPSAATEKFLAYVHEQTNILPFQTLKLIWRALVQCSMTWFAEKKRPIDFGFIELHPVPYRVNWAQILRAMHPKSPRACNVNNWSEERKLAVLMEMGFMKNLNNTVLLSMNPRTNCIHWRVEASLKREWWKVTDEIEETHRSQVGPVQYAKSISSQIARRREKMVQVYGRWAREASRPSGRLDDGKLFGSKVIVPWIPPGKVTAWTPPDGPVEVCVDTESSLESEDSKPEDLAVEAVERLL